MHPGEVGKVVLTPLHNFAMPLLRYEILDYAEVGEACSCGRGSLVLKRLLGPPEKHAIGRDGQRFWSNVSRKTWSVIEGIEELQLAQVGPNHMEARMVCHAIWT